MLLGGDIERNPGPGKVRPQEDELLVANVLPKTAQLYARAFSELWRHVLLQRAESLQAILEEEGLQAAVAEAGAYVRRRFARQW